MRPRLLLVASAAAAALVGCFGFFASAPAASAAVLIRIDKSTQHMTVNVDGQQRYSWPVSTGAPGYDTPSGSFKTFRMEASHFSKEWDDAPMPHSIFFTKEGHAIHGSYAKSIGEPASHGCVRLSPEHAATLYKLVQEQGLPNTQVVLTGITPGGGAAVASSKRRQPRTDEYTSDDDQTYAGYAAPRSSASVYDSSREPRGTYYGGGGTYDRDDNTNGYQPYYAPAPQPTYAPRPQYYGGWQRSWP
ncbi:MAG TPA: L,D-transpeptidase [Pseudolabrys sp.]|nr:L,D-transpeptidase [Pseudolabrys sp.]